jgi:signal transduction histidine kinase
MLIVEDDGPGLPERLIEAVARGDDDQAAFDGALGLWLIVRFARLHGGSVTVSRTTRDHGARFEVWLPARESADGGA